MQTKHIDKITEEDWNQFEIFSPKMAKVLENIKKHKNQLGFLYSEFVTGEGLAIFAKILQREGYISWEDSQSLELMEYAADREKPVMKVYAIITGKIDLDERTRILEAFNSEDNMHGEKLAFLLVNKIAAEGLDLKGVRHIHILEPFWNYARIEQIIGRGVRYKSHDRFPDNEKNVQPYVYLSDYPTSYPKEKIKEPTTDIDMFEKVMRNKIINDKFNLSVVESSIDCLVHHESLSENVKKKIKCKLCSPTNKPLYHPLIAKDFSVPDPCNELKEYKIHAKEIKAEGSDETFAYVVDNKSKPPKIYIYILNPEINGYTILKSNHPLYGTLMNKILDTLEE